MLLPVLFPCIPCRHKQYLEVAIVFPEYDFIIRLHMYVATAVTMFWVWSSFFPDSASYAYPFFPANFISHPIPPLHGKESQGKPKGSWPFLLPSFSLALFFSYFIPYCYISIPSDSTSISSFIFGAPVFSHFNFCL